MTCNSSSSNISGTPIAGEVTQVGSQLKVDVVQASHGFTSGNVIRFDVDSNGYTLAQADSPANAEVCGVVAEGSVSTNIFGYVMAGDIIMNTFAETGAIAGSTAAEVFFLSSVTAGVMDSTPPNDAGSVLKTVVVRLPSVSINGVTQDKGIVKNYVGNYLGGDTAVYMSGVNPVGSIHAFAGDATKVPTGWALCNGSPISASSYPDFASTINKLYGFRDSITFTSTEPPQCDTVELGNIVATVIEIGNNRLLVEYTSFRTSQNIDGVRGENGQASFTETSLSPVGFQAGDKVRCISRGTFVEVTVDTVTLDSVLTPDLRNKFIMGATGDSTNSGLNKQGGSEKIEMNLISNQDTNINFGISETTESGLTSIENLPPYVTTNWIIRLGDSSYTSFLNQLSLKTLSITDLPSSDPNVAGSLYAGVDGIVKVSAG
jgi:hypothetical protein